MVRAGAVVDGEALTEALRELCGRAGSSGPARCTSGIANAGVLVRQLDLDWMPPADFRKALRYQVQDVLPFSVDEANLDYHLLDELERRGEDGSTRRVARILLVAAAREVVDAFVARRAGRRPARRAASTCCRSRWCAPAAPRSARTPTAAPRRSSTSAPTSCRWSCTSAACRATSG